MNTHTNLENTEVTPVESNYTPEEGHAPAPDSLDIPQNDGSAQKKKRRFKVDTNQVLSSFLVLAYLVCMYFVEQMIMSMENGILKNALEIGLFVLFGLLLFYATRVGDGKQIRRFSLSVLLMMVLPGLYITLSFFLPLPLGELIYNSTLVQLLGPVLLGYGIPYMFLSGFEREIEEKDAPKKQAGVPADPDYVPGSTLDIAFNTDEGDALADEENSSSDSDESNEQP